MSEKRSNFTGKIGFVLAAAGSAVGLGNIWRFPYLAAKYGGGIFLLVYILLAITFGFALMCAEIAIGRKTGTSAVRAFGALNKKYGFIGWIASLIPMIILPYYSVIGGWVTKYITVFVSGNVSAAAKDDYFTGFISKPFEPIGWFLIFIGITALIVLFGVEKGVEKVSKWMMPILVVLTLIIAVYGLFMPGAMDGLIYYIKPDFSKFSATTVLAAMGQLFYSMSLAMGIMITFGSYMPKKADLEKSVTQVEIFDTGVAFLAGLMIVPAVFVFSNGDSSMLAKGPSLMFVMLPKVFDSMAFSSVIAAVFFILVLLAALTSSISLLETLVAVLMDKFHMKRGTACITMFIIALLLAVPSSLGFGAWSNITILGFDFLDFFDFISKFFPGASIFSGIIWICD